MAYISDQDLNFLGELKSKELDTLVHCLTHDKDGEKRWTEELTENERFKKHNPDHHQYWELIGAEIQCYGANTFLTLLRGGKGVKYKEILIDVCDKMKVNYNKKASTETIEGNLLMKIVTDAIDKMSPEELKKLATTTGIKNTNDITPQAMVGAFQAIFRAGGFKSYQLTVMVVNTILKATIGRGLSFTVTGPMMQAAKIFSGPIGWAVTGVWAAYDISGAAYRVTIPAVIQVAALRQKYQYDRNTDDVSVD